jgi:V/A-type H+-transporting ATPase subunit I
MIVTMKKLLLAARSQERQQVLNILQQAGVIHVEPVAEGLKGEFADLNRDIARTIKAIEVLEQVAVAGQRLPPPGTPSRLVEEFHAVHGRLAEIDTQSAAIRDEMGRVEVWGRIQPADLQALRDRGFEVRFFQASLDAFSSLEAEVIHQVREEKSVVSAITVSKTPARYDLGVVEVKQPEKDFFTLESDLTALRNEAEQLKGKLSELAGRLSDLRDHLYDLNDQKRFAEVESKLQAVDSVFYLTGWVPAAQVAEVETALTGAGLPAAIHFDDVADADLPPTKLENSPWIRPIEAMFSFLGITPGYREADISPFFFPFLVIFSGMLIADAGYGFTVLLGMAVMYGPLRRKGIAGETLQLVMALMAGAAVYGMLTNSWFSTTKIRLTSFNPSSPEGEEFLKIFCFLLGAIHITIAHAWKIRRNPIGLGSLAEVGWIIFLWAMLDVVNLLVIGGKSFPALTRFTMPAFYISLTMITFFTAPPQNISEWGKDGPGGIAMNLLSWIGQGLGAIALNAASFLSDLISYIRLWAVGLAGSILGASFNDMAASMPFVLMVIVLVAAHLMNFALALVAILAHGVRLNLLEFSNHLGMEWSGRVYDPFRKEKK